MSPFVEAEGRCWAIPADLLVLPIESEDLLTPLTTNEQAAVTELVFFMSSPHTPEQIAEYVGLDPRSVRRIEVRALTKLRRVMSGDWDTSLREPTQLVRRCGDVFAGDGRTPKWEAD